MLGVLVRYEDAGRSEESKEFWCKSSPRAPKPYHLGTVL